MPTNNPSAEAAPLPEIDRSDLDTVRRFLTSRQDEDHRSRPAEAKGPAFRHGIARSRVQSVSRAGR